LNIKDFEVQIDSKILSRGREYYRCGYIASLEYDDREWVADVEGSDSYTVTVRLSDNGDITDTHCDCPYDWGEYCKHQVAVFFELREKHSNPAAKAKSQKSHSKESLESILSKLDKQTLISLLLEYSKIYKSIASEIQFRYSQKSDKSDSARKLIRSAINAVSHRGYVEYRDVRHAVNGANEVLNMIDDMLDSNEHLSAVSLAIIVAEEMMELLNSCDDSNGYVGGAISEAIGKIHAATHSVSSSNNNEIFSIVIKHALDQMYDGWIDWRIDLLSALVPLCKDKKNRVQLESYLVTQDSHKTSEWSRDYDLRRKQQIQFELISNFDGDAAAQAYINQNLDNIDFRYTAIKDAIKNNNYDKATVLCIEGEKQNFSMPGIVKQLREFLYIIYEATGNLLEQKALALSLLTDGDFKYYEKYKELHHTNEWATILEDFLEKLNRNGSRGIYVKILVHEKHKPRLLKYCQKSTESIIKYHKILLPEYKREVVEIFLTLIRTLAARASSRSAYNEVCGVIQLCENSCIGSTSEVCAEITQQYARRPAFMDEMRKIGKL